MKNTTKAKNPTKASAEQIAEWKGKYKGVYEVETETGSFIYLSDPMEKLPVMKVLIGAMVKGSFEFVDALINNCWIGGDESIKTNNMVKTGIFDKVKDIIEIPDAEIEYSEDGKAVVTIESKTITVRLAERQEIKFAEDKNKGSKPLDTQIYLLDKIADKEEIKSWREDTRLYLGLLNAVDQLKERVHVSIKKL